MKLNRKEKKKILKKNNIYTPCVLYSKYIMIEKEMLH